MHEYSLATEILRICRDKIPSGDQNKPVKTVHLAIGEMQQVIPDSLFFYFGEVAKDTPFAHAKLEITDIPLAGTCKECLSEVRFDQPPFVCPKCRSDKIKLTSGFELKVVSLTF